MKNPEIKDTSIELPVVSVIVPARNEVLHIVACLNSLRNQEYPQHLLEIIVVDDHSTDSTAALAAQMGVRLIRLQDEDLPSDTIAFKKAALSSGVRHANGELIMTTDADCKANPKWVSSMVHCLLHTEAVCVSGPVFMQPGNTILEKFQSLDYSILQGITAAAITGGLHDLSSGANMCYRKKAFEEVSGFSGIDHLASGDDMLLQQKFRNQYPLKVHHCWNHDTIVVTDPEKTFKDFLRQRIRWSSKTSSYTDTKIKLILMQVYLLNVAIVSLTICSFFSYYYLLALLALLIFKILIEWRFTKSILIFFGNEFLMAYFIAFQPIHIFYVVVSGFLGSVGKYKWKGRTVR